MRSRGRLGEEAYLKEELVVLKDDFSAAIKGRKRIHEYEFI
jgi:hypothetical protein